MSTSPTGKSHNRDLLMVSISKFYTNKNSIQKILPIVSGASRISLRLVDWFVTNYAKRHNVTIVNVIDGHSVHFNVYASYRAQLKAYSKQQFDPFRRRDRIDFYYERNQFVETTIGQLNFFRWMLHNTLIEYIDENFEAVEAEMLKSQKAEIDCSNKGISGGHDKKQHPSTFKRVAQSVTTTPPRTVLFD